MKPLKTKKSLMINSLEHLPAAESEMQHDMVYLKDKELQEFKKKLSIIDESIRDYFEFILNTSIKEIENKSLNARGYTFVDEMKELTKNKFCEPETLFNYIKEIIQKIIHYKNDNIEKLKKRDITVEGSYDEILTNLETEIRNHIKENNKLKLYIDTAQLRMNDINNLNYQKDKDLMRYEEEIKNLTKEIEYIKKTNDEDKNNLMKKIELNDITIRKMEQQIFEQKRNSPSDGRRASVKRPPGTAPNFSSQARSSILLSNKEYVTMFENLTGKGVKNQKDQNSNILSHKLIQAYQKNQTDSKVNDYKISRLKIQVTQKNKDVNKLEKRTNELFTELKKIKDDQIEEDQKKWSKEINSDTNQNSINFYKKKIEEKEKRIQELEKKVKKFAILEKKIFVKEKAFEFERADYHDKLIYLNDRVTNLTRYINQNTDKTKDHHYGKYNNKDNSFMGKDDH